MKKASAVIPSPLASTWLILDMPGDLLGESGYDRLAVDPAAGKPQALTGQDEAAPVNSRAIVTP
jgi:hypothetical protein